VCGIFGICRVDGAPVIPREVWAATRALQHRGPDDEGYLLADTATGRARCLGGSETSAAVAHAGGGDAPVGDIVQDGRADHANLALSNRRLAIVDLTAAGHQPMSARDRALWITHNGEIYNFADVRAELAGRGHSFRSGTDTEVVLHAYDEWGTDCVRRFNGMWAFAIWDRESRKLVISRDRLGVKPLYYFWDGTTLAFASELKALLALPGTPRRANEEVVDDYLAYGLVDHTDGTFFEHIHPLAPGHLLELDIERRRVAIKAWYALPDAATDGTTNSVESVAADFRDLFEDAVRLRLISDVPVGTCLSGGLDSSAIVCMVDRLLGQGVRPGAADRQHTFSARYDDPEHDEGRWIDAVARETSIERHFTWPTAGALHGDLEDLIWHQDEPFGSTSIYAQWCVFRAARDAGVVVTLDGQGGDEVAGGYMHYFGPNLARLIREASVGQFLREQAAYRHNHDRALRPILVRTGAALLPWAVRRRLTRVRRPDWLALGSRPAPEPAAFAEMPSDPLRAQIYRDLTVGLRQLLRFCDRNSMAHSVESRLPFLDYRLAERGYLAPAAAKIRDGTTKRMLRDGLVDILPAEVRNRQLKIGFSTPEASWFRTTFRPNVEEILSSRSFAERPWFSVEKVRTAYAAHLAGADRSREVWRWINFELWARRFLD
jgi:asparagine synthase (glutamine-hydrolysing)